MRHTDIKELEGKVIEKITGACAGSEKIEFHTECGRKYILFHEQDCCESVSVEDVNGNPDVFSGKRVVSASEVAEHNDCNLSESETWTYYIIRCAEETLHIRWYGTSNGYYSETAYFAEVAV